MGHSVVNIREDNLIDSLNKLIPKLITTRDEMNATITSVRLILSRLLPTNDRTKIEVIKHEVLSYFSVTEDELSSESSIGDILRARHIFNHMAYQKTSASYAQIGLIVNRNHASVMHSKTVLNNAEFTKDELFNQYKAIESIVDEIIKTPNK